MSCTFLLSNSQISNIVNKSKSLVYKVILLGDAGVGKTCVINRYVKNTFSDYNKSTVGIDFANKVFQRDELFESTTLFDEPNK